VVGTEYVAQGIARYGANVSGYLPKVGYGGLELAGYASN